VCALVKYVVEKPGGVGHYRNRSVRSAEVENHKVTREVDVTQRSDDLLNRWGFANAPQRESSAKIPPASSYQKCEKV